MLENVFPRVDFTGNTASLLDPNNNVLLDSLLNNTGTTTSGTQIILTTAFTFGVVAITGLVICAVYRFKSKKTGD